MKKLVILVSFMMLLIAGCEKDDFCLQNPVTPSLILSFYDATNTETLKRIESITVWAEGKDSIFINEPKDSIFIPLNSLATQTVYNFSDGINTDTFTINYTPEEEYVSRSCGFKVTFNEVTFESTNTWIQSFTPSTLTKIEDQNAAHVQIFH